MTATSSGNPLNLRAIRAHEGSQARAWEEVAYQLRPPVGDGHIETRKTRAPDAGVEWYEIYADGHEEGFQAKFNANLAEALGGMRESVAAVCKKRPNLHKLTFVVPYDFTDSGNASQKSDQKRWEEAVDRWRTDFPASVDIDFSTIRAGDITAELVQQRHAGLREYWFGQLELSDSWLMHRFEESVSVAGSRYTPEADSASRVNGTLDALVCGPSFIQELRSAAEAASKACRHDTGIWGAESVDVETLIDSLDQTRAESFGSADAGDFALPTAAPDIVALARISDALLQSANQQMWTQAVRERRSTRVAIRALTALQNLATNEAAEALMSRSLALVGPSGQGKTHALLRLVARCLQRGVPALAIMGERLSDKNWWPAVADTLGGVAVTSDEFLQALDSIAEARGCRALIVLDAINESQSPKRWKQELPAMLAQFERYPHIALVISYRTDYRQLIGEPESLLKVRHPGLAGNEAEALGAYCKLFGIPVPSTALFEPAFTSPLFLRMYCEVLAAEVVTSAGPPTRSSLFERYKAVIGKKVTDKLGLPPTSPLIADAISHIADKIVANDGRPVARDLLEQQVDGLLPHRIWPETLFQRLASEGLVELRPSYDEAETVAFPFQAYSEHLLSRRIMDSVTPPTTTTEWKDALRERIAKATWSWRSMAVLLPEQAGIELTDLLPPTDDYRLAEAMRESLTDRDPASFGTRARELLEAQLKADSTADGGIETVIALSPRPAHPGNADWLHSRLVQMSMGDRDATWSIAAFGADEYSEAIPRLSQWSARFAASASEEEVRLASTAMMWLLTSPNRFLRDSISKTLVSLMASQLKTAQATIERAQEVNDPYVQERVLTCCYGAVLVGGDADPGGARAILEAVSNWQRVGLPIDVIARDSARGIATWCADRGLLDESRLDEFEPPYGAAPPTEPPSREELELSYGPLKDAHGEYSEWRASAILHSCLDWYGDFNKYVVKSDVEFFSLYPLSGSVPTLRDRSNPLDQVSIDWAGRWIAHRAISLGWATTRFEDFEANNDLRRGREGHKAERFGKKYQWIAHRELLARLADNYHPSYDRWRGGHDAYQGPWDWAGRDFDPTLPASRLAARSRICEVARDSDAGWAVLQSPEMDIAASPDDWVALSDDLPEAESMFVCIDPAGRRWIATQRYSTWDRDNSERTGMSKRERDVFFLQFSWTVPRGRGRELYQRLIERGLAGRWMPEMKRTHQQYLGESGWSPIASANPFEIDDHDSRDNLADLALHPRPAVEHYLWEGNTLDCSIDESVDLYAPTAGILGSARWRGYRSEWEANGTVIARAIEVQDGEKPQEVLLMDSDWLAARLDALDQDMVIGTLSERHALPEDDDNYRRMAFSDVWYAALVTAEAKIEMTGPLMKVRGRVADHRDGSS